MVRAFNIIGIVFVYNPDIEDLIININQYINYIDELVIWRNSKLSKDDEDTVLSKVICKDKITYLGDGNNVGISSALNEFISYANEKRYKYILSMDQDSYWINFNDYITMIRGIEDNSAYIYGPETIDFVIDSTIINKDKSWIYKDYVITSGAVYDITLFDAIGGFNESYFIDGLDEEICYRAKKRNLNTLQIQGCYLKQKFGNHRIIKILKKNIIIPNYSAFRYYYIVRNHIWIAKSGITSKKNRNLMIRNYVISFPIKAILFESDKIKKINRIYKGIIDGIFTYPE